MTLDAVPQPGLEQWVTELAAVALESTAPEELDVTAQEYSADPQSVLAAAATPVVKYLVSAVADSAKEAVEPLIAERVRRLFRRNAVGTGTQVQAPPQVFDAAQPLAGGQPGPALRDGHAQFLRDTASGQVTSQAAVGEAASLHLRVEAGRKAGHTFELRPGNLTIGRAPDAAIRLDDNTVSHNHALLIVTTDNVTIQDCRSTNGTILNGTKIGDPETLRAGDLLQVGTVVLTIEDYSPENHD